jgi:hypothetical protein
VCNTQIFSGEKRLSRSLPETGVGEVGEGERGQAIREATELRQRIITAYAHMQHVRTITTSIVI